MAKDLIIIDSCVLIKAFRKNSEANNDLKEIINHTAYSVITQLELLVVLILCSRKTQLLKFLNPITESL